MIASVIYGATTPGGNDCQACPQKTQINVKKIGVYHI